MIAQHLVIPSPGQLWDRFIDVPGDFSPVEVIPGRPGVSVVLSSYHACSSIDPGSLFWALFVIADSDGNRLLKLDTGQGPNSAETGIALIHNTNAQETRLAAAPGASLLIFLDALNGSYPDSGPLIRLTGYFNPVRLPLR